MNDLAKGVGSDGSELCSVTLPTVSRLQRTWLGQLAVSLSPVEHRLCRFCMCGSHNSACTWLIDEICRQAFFATAIWNEINLHKCVQASFSSMCACYLVRSLMLVHFPLIEPGSTCRSGNVQRDIIALQYPVVGQHSAALGLNFNFNKLSTNHDVQQCSMTNPYHGENPGPVSILH